MTAQPPLDEARIEAFVGQIVTELSATISGVLTNIGHKLGLYRAMAGAGPMTSAELAHETGTHERYVREWLNNQAAGGYVTYDPAVRTYELPLEHAMVLATSDSPVFMAPALDVTSSLWHDEDKVIQAFRTGKGIGWHEHHHRLFCGTEAFFRTGYRAHLTTEWIPALEGVEKKLRAGAKVADIGCGHGASTIVMAEAFPESVFHGFDYHEESIKTARQRAQETGVANQVTFDVATAKDFPGRNYDLVCFMDCLHDLGDPVGAARHTRAALSPEGSVLLVEPFAGDRVEDNLNPVGRMYYAASTAICTPNSLSQEVALGLGAQAGEKRLSEVLAEAGFTSVRRATETPFNIILDVRP